MKRNDQDLGRLGVIRRGPVSFEPAVNNLDGGTFN